jgi:hypothetical protein
MLYQLSYSRIVFPKERYFFPAKSSHPAGISHLRGNFPTFAMQI